MWRGGSLSSMRFSAYGTFIESEIPLTGLPPPSGKPVSAVKFKSGCPHHTLADQKRIIESPKGWVNIVCAGGGSPVFRIDEVGEFHLCPEESAICCRLMPGTSMERVRYWLMHYVLPVYLLLDPRFDFLHGSAVDIDGGGVAFLADAMGGKSTLANFFVQQGHGLLTDDHLGIFRRDVFLAIPSVPFVRPYREFEDLGNPVERFASQPLPLRAIYLLELSDGPARVIPRAGLPVAVALARNRRLRVSNKFTELAKTRFSRLAELAASIPVAKLCVPRDLSRLPEVYETILAHLGELHDSI